jgi:hypothetical protein
MATVGIQQLSDSLAAVRLIIHTGAACHPDVIKLSSSPLMTCLPYPRKFT